MAVINFGSEMRDKIKAFRDELNLNVPDYIRANSVVEFLDRILSGPDLESRVSQLESQMAEIKKGSIKPGDKITIIKTAHLDDGQLILNNGRYFKLSRQPICEGKPKRMLKERKG